MVDVRDEGCCGDVGFDGKQIVVNHHENPKIMVRRIIPDSDFEEELDEQRSDERVMETPSKDGISDSEGGQRAHTPPMSPLANDNPPRSVKRLVRGKTTTTDVSYSYDSDIYTEEESIGSFIVYTDDESLPEKTESGTSTIILLIQMLNRYFVLPYYSNLRT
jgi:hypothetical protein